MNDSIGKEAGSRQRELGSSTPEANPFLQTQAGCRECLNSNCLSVPFILYQPLMRARNRPGKRQFVSKTPTTHTPIPRLVFASQSRVEYNGERNDQANLKRTLN